MACKIVYNNQEFTNDEFFEYVNSNPQEFQSYMNPEVFDSSLNPSVDYKLKVVKALESEKVRQPNANNFEGFLNDLRKQGVSEVQLQFVKDAYKPGMTKDDLMTTLAASMTYTISIETATWSEYRTYRGGAYFIYQGYEYEAFEDGDVMRYRKVDEIDTNNNYVEPERYITITKEEFEEARRLSGADTNVTNTEYYKETSVPGGTNYEENEIRTPEIVPSIKGHAQFSTDNGIGWFRSDAKSNETSKFPEDDMADSGLLTASKTRRILEIQSDLFQKARYKPSLVGETHVNLEDLRWDMRNASQAEYEAEYLKRSRKIESARENQFLQLLNKDNNWVTFFIKSIIQDSIRRDYIDILFPTGKTASKIEGHDNLEDFVRERQLRLDFLLTPANFVVKINGRIIGKYETEEDANNTVEIHTKATGQKVAVVEPYNSAQDQVEIDQLRREIQGAQDGTIPMSSIASFYETTIFNILKKQGYNPVRVTDEYGNDWYKVELGKEDVFTLDSSLSDLADGLKSAASNQKKFEAQLERVRQEASKVQKKINSIENETVRTRLRDALRLVQDANKAADLKNFVYFILEASETLKYYSERLRNIQSLPAEAKIAELDRIKTISDNFKDLVSFLKKDFRFINDSNEFKTLINNLSNYQDQIDNIYTAEAEQLAIAVLTEELSEDQKKALALLQKEIDNVRVQIEKAKEAQASEKYIKKLEDKVKDLKDKITKFVPDESLIEETFEGLRGDLNWITGNLRSVIAMGDPIVSGFSRKLKRGFDKIRRTLIPIRDEAYEIIRQYEKEMGVNPRMSMTKYYEGLYEIQELAFTEDGEVKKNKYYTLLSPYKESFYNDKLELEQTIKDLKAKGAPIQEIEKAEKKYRDWLSKYAERRYKDEWYDRYNLLTPEAAEARQFIIDDMNNILRGPNRDALTEADVEKLHELKYQLKRLGSLRNEDGTMKTGTPLAIAESIQKFNKKTAEMSYWETTAENLAWFNIILNKKKEQLAQGLISQDDFDRWYAMNTQRNISQEFYKERQVIIDTIQSIMSKLPKEQFKEDIKQLWDSIFDVSRPYRDEDNILDGSQVTNEEAIIVRSTEEAIEDLKRKLIRFSGLTIDEEQELQGLWGGLDSLTPQEIQRFMELRDQKQAYSDYIKGYLSDAELNLLMTSFAKLAEISRWQPTEYYKTVYNNQLHDFRMSIDPAFLLELTEVEERFKNSDWFKRNHVTKTKKVVDDEGHIHFTEVEEPLYIWKDILPTNPKYIEEGAPGFAFKTRIVKDEYVNPNYKLDIKERVVPKKIVDGKLSPYINENYEALRTKSIENDKDKARWDMLQFLTRTHLDGQEKLPTYKRLGQFLPGIIKDTYDRTLDRGVKGTAQAIRQSFIKTQEDRDLVLGDVSQIELSVMPVKFTTKVSTDDQSLNLAEIILKHRAAAEEYEYLESQLGEAKVIQSALRTSKENISDSKINDVLKRLGFDKFIKADKESRRSRVFNEFVRTMFYGETETAFPEIFTGVNTNKLVNNVLGLSSMQIMTFNFPAHLTNLLSGEVQNVIEASAGKYFTLKDYFKAKSIYLANVNKFWGDYGKEGHKSFWSALADRLDVPQGEFIDNLGRKTNFSRLRTLKSHIMIVKNVGEHEMQVSTMIAMANNYKVKLNGSVVPLYSALENVNGKINIRAGVTKINDGQPFTEKDLNEFENKVHSVVRALNGAYSKFDRTLAEKTVLGKLFFYMRKYFMPMFFRRYETFKYDYEEQEYKEGYYTTGLRLLKDLIKFNTDVVKNWSTYKDSLTAEEKRNLRRLAAELGIIVSLYFLVMLMGGYDRDRELKGRWLHSMAMYQLMKVKSETETFLPGPGFNELSTLFSSPFAAATTAKTTVRIFADIVNTLQGDPDAYFQRDYGIWEEGDLRLKADVLKLLGFNGNIITPDNLVKNFELRNR